MSGLRAGDRGGGEVFGGAEGDADGAGKVGCLRGVLGWVRQGGAAGVLADDDASADGEEAGVYR